MRPASRMNADLPIKAIMTGAIALERSATEDRLRTGEVPVDTSH